MQQGPFGDVDQALRDKIFADITKDAAVTDEEARQYYDENRETLFKVEEQVQVKAGFVLMNKNSVWAIDGNYAISQILTGSDSINNQYNSTIGHRYFGGFRKASGNFQFGISHTYKAPIKVE